jgi:hypothetical protein
MKCPSKPYPDNQLVFHQLYFNVWSMKSATKMKMANNGIPNEPTATPLKMPH